MSDPLDDLIKEWRIEPSLPADLSACVQADIALRTRRPWFFDTVAALDVWCARPRAIAACLTVALLLGVVIAELRVREKEGQVEREMTERYLSLLEPADH